MRHPLYSALAPCKSLSFYSTKRTLRIEGVQWFSVSLVCTETKNCDMWVVSYLSTKIWRVPRNQKNPCDRSTNYNKCRRYSDRPCFVVGNNNCQLCSAGVTNEKHSRLHHRKHANNSSTYRRRLIDNCDRLRRCLQLR